MKTKVYCQLTIEGTHYWETCGIKEVEYLKHPHRHRFGIRCEVSVDGDDREVEFICLKHKVRDYLMDRYGDAYGICAFGGMSCEMIAKDLIREFMFDKCAVDEDGENGAEVER